MAPAGLLAPSPEAAAAGSAALPRTPGLTFSRLLFPGLGGGGGGAGVGGRGGASGSP